MRRNLRYLTTFSLLASASVFAAGFNFGENGTKALLQGGAFAGQADDLSAIMHNPAGLAQQSGFNFLVDAQLLNHATTFWRMDPGFDVSNPQSLANPVSNQGGLFFSPFLSASYNFARFGPKLTVAWGLYGPPSVGRYSYPSVSFDEAGKYTDNPRKISPQRYSFLNNDVKILFHTLSAAYELHRVVQVGASFQIVQSSFFLRRALYSGLFEPKTQREELPAFDSVTTTDMSGSPTFTAIIGVLVKPHDDLSIGASFRPQVPLRASGKLLIELGENARAFNTQVTGDQAELALTLPVEVRAGIHWQPSFVAGLGINADFVYQGWQSVSALVLTPKDVSITIGSGMPQSVGEVRIPKNWGYSLSGRLGASYDIGRWVTAHAGFMYETAASKDAYQSLEFLHFDRFFITGGASVHIGPVDIIAGIAYTPSVTKNITDSEVRATTSDPTVRGHLVGMGQYTSGGYSIAMGVRGHFGGKEKATRAPEPTSPPKPATPAAEQTKGADPS